MTVPDDEATKSAGAPADETVDWKAATDKLRDVIKWVAAAFGALGALMIGTAPLSNIAKADLVLEFWLAIALGLIALVAVGFIFWTATSLLVPDPLELNELSGAEYADLVKRVDANARDYLGSHGDSFADFLHQRVQARTELTNLDRAFAVQADAKLRAKLTTARKQMVDRINVQSQVRARLLAWADFQKLQSAFEQARWPMFVAAIVAAIGITGFHAAAGAAVPDATGTSTQQHSDHVNTGQLKLL